METYDNTRFTWIEKLESPRESELSNSLAIANFKTNMVCKNDQLYLKFVSKVFYS